MLTPRSLRGFTMVELMVSVAILSILLAIGVPSLSDWIKRGAITTMGESLQNGLKQAFGDAIRQNAPVEFILTDSSVLSSAVASAVAKENGKNWLSRVLNRETFPTTLDTVAFIASGAASELSGTNELTVEGPASVIFNGSGRILDKGGALLSSYQVYRVSRVGTDRAMCVFVSPGGGVKSCDPAFESGDARACEPILTAAECRKAGT